MEALKTAMVSLLNSIQCVFVTVGDTCGNEHPAYRGSAVKGSRFNRKTTAALRTARRGQ